MFIIDYAVETYDLSKEYDGISVVDQVNMHIPAGEIYGFIGRNGAGKTTMIRMITGLIRPSGGEISLFGESEAKELEEMRKTIGAVVETPTFYKNMTGRENLEMHRRLLGLPKSAADEALGFTGGEEFSDQLAQNLSMGQRQRMGLARAMMGNPKLLVLDEPTNGVDPEGILDFRQKLETLRLEYGTTILISSHILSELSQIATWYGVIDGGKLLEEFPATGLSYEPEAEIFTDTPEKLLAYLIEKYPLMSPEICNTNAVKVNILREDMPKLNYELAKESFAIFEIRWTTETLESRFMHLMQGEGEE